MESKTAQDPVPKRKPSLFFHHDIPKFQEHHLEPLIFIKKSMFRKISIPVTPGSKSTFKINYVIVGDPKAKNKYFFVCGMHATMFNYDSSVRYFASQPDSAICVFDNRGVGNSETPPGILRYKTTDFANDAIFLCQAIGWTKNIIFCGGSMGGMIIQHIALQRPEYFRAMIIWSTHAGSWIAPITPITTIFGNFGRTALQSSLDKQIWSSLDMLYSDKFLHSPGPDPHFLSNREYLFAHKKASIRMLEKTMSPQVALAHIAATQTHSLSHNDLKKLKQFKFPKLIMHTGKDQMVIPQRTKDLASWIESDIHEFESSGHVPNIEVAEDFHAKISSFFVEKITP